MLVFRGSMNFTSHPEVLIAPRAPIDPDSYILLIHINEYVYTRDVEITTL